MKMIELKITRPGKPTMIAFFKDQEQAKIFHEWVQELIASVEAKCLKDTGKLRS